jgi:hypothetical protein
VPLTPFSLSMLNKTYYISKTFCEEKNWFQYIPDF